MIDIILEYGTVQWVTSPSGCETGGPVGVGGRRRLEEELFWSPRLGEEFSKIHTIYFIYIKNINS
jgi:hypothetical protein